MPIRCLIVDDSSRFVDVAGELLEEQGIHVLGSAANAEDAVRLAGELHPDLALVDIDLGRESGLSVARQLRGELGGELAGAVILISTHAEEDFEELLEASPAIGFLAKSELSAEAIEALLKRPQQDRGS